MKKSFAGLVLSVLCGCLTSCSPSSPPAFSVTPESLQGTWHSDHELTMKYARSNVTDEQTVKTLDAIAGHDTVTYTANRIVVEATAWEAEINGATMRAPPSRVELPYADASASDRTVSISTGVSPAKVTHTIHFDDANTIWVEEQFGPANAPKVREYYRRAP